jgi:hypothetical protein
MRRIYFTIFSVSCSVLMFEISLTRIFSIYLWYHFAFMVISIAMLGIGCAGTLLAVCSGGIRNSRRDIRAVPSIIERIRPWMYSEANTALYAALTGISVLICYVISNYIPFDPVKFSWEKTQFLYLAMYCFVLSVPFFFSGILIATVFSLHSEEAMPVYSSDLLGAGAGSLAVLYLLNTTSPEYAVLTASTLCLVGALATGGKKVKILTVAFLAVNLSAFLTHPVLINVKLSPYKSLSLLLKYPGAEHLNTYHSSYSRIDTFKSPGVRFAPGLSLKYLEPLPEQIGLAVDGDSVSVITSAEDRSRLRFLEFLPSSIAYELRKNGKVIVIDPKGGLQTLMARHYGPYEIHSVESNPLTVRILRDNYSEFSDDIYGRDTYTGYGRNYLALAGKKDHPELPNGGYDVIDISMTDTSVSGLFGISEDYRYTVEAFKTYLSALKKDGILSISTYLIPPPRTEFRVLATILSAFEKMHIEDGSGRIAAIRSWDSMTILVRNSPFTGDEIELIKTFCRDRRFDLVYYPGIKEGESNKYIKLPSDEYFTGFNNILDTNLRKPFMDNYLFDIKPVYDDNPFFHYYLRLNKIELIYSKMGRRWMYFMEEGYILPAVLVIILVLCIILILSPFIFDAISGKHFQRFKLPSAFPAFIYFSMLGLGFMFVEVSLIQKTFLLLENPSYTLAVILSSILISSGFGSMASSKYPEVRTYYSPLLLSVLVLLYSVTHPLLLDILTPYPLKARMIVMAASILPLGFFMGIPFPLGIKILGRKYGELVPWAWAINACMSVLAPILTIMLALAIGFKTVLWIGSAAYVLAFLSLSKLMKL